MQTPDEVPILYLRIYSIRELDTVHIAHTCPARPFTGDLETKLSHQLPFAESARAVDGSFPVERGQMQPKEHHCIKLQHRPGSLGLALVACHEGFFLQVQVWTNLDAEHVGRGPADFWHSPY